MEYFLTGGLCCVYKWRGRLGSRSSNSLCCDYRDCSLKNQHTNDVCSRAMELANQTAIEENGDDVKVQVRPSLITDSASYSEAVYRGAKKDEKQLANESLHAHCHL